MRNLIRLAAIIGIVSLPLTSFAQTTTQSQVSTTTNSSACPLIGRTLKYGVSGDDVTRLQQYLAQDTAVYPEGQATGFYGSLTQSAVQRWQVKYNIVSSGTPASTGYGMVGPRTAAAIALLCSTKGGGSGGSSTVGGFIQVTPISGNAPLTTNITAAVNTTGYCGGGSYNLDFGDGSPMQAIPVASGNCNQVSQTYPHTYQYGGAYVVTLSSGTHKTTATIAVYGAANPNPVITPTQPTTTSNPTALNGDTLNASVSSGAAPLNVVFTGIVSGADAGSCTSNCFDQISFGDGTTGLIPLPTSASAFQSYTISHIYNSNGSFSVGLARQSQASCQSTTGSCPTVASTIITSTTVTVSGTSQTTQTAQSSYGIISVNPGVNNNPFAVTAQLALPACPTYSLNWGDGTSPAGITQASCTGNNTTRNESHTYSQNGSYTVTLRDATGNTQGTATVNISN